MEQEPRQLGPFRLEFDTGQEIVCHRGNTAAFIHSEEPFGDHLFIRVPAIDDQPETGHYVFREQVTNFDEIVGRMSVSDWSIITAERLEDGDREAYEEFIARKEANLKRMEERKLTLRQNNTVAYLGYLLLNEHLTPDDFTGTGELFI